jgi:Uma2 family endonuclease
MATEKTLLTADDLLRLPDDGMRHELIRGELRTMPPAGGEHGIVAGELFHVVSDHVHSNDLGFVLAAETGFFIERNPDVVRAPDLAFIRKDRLSGGRPSRGYFDIPPDLLAEVVSPYDPAQEILEKVLEWLRFGVRLVWVVYPSTKSVMVYRTDEDISVREIDDMLDGEDVLPGFRCPVQALFPYLGG